MHSIGLVQCGSAVQLYSVVLCCAGENMEEQEKRDK